MEKKMFQKYHALFNAEEGACRAMVLFLANSQKIKKVNNNIGVSIGVNLGLG